MEKTIRRGPGRPRKLFLDDEDSLRRFRAAVTRLVGHAATARQLDDLAHKASEIHGPGVKWTGSYIYGLLRGYPDYKLRPELLIALESCMGVTHARSVMLQINNGVKVESGAKVLISSRRCGRPTCNAPFIPKSHNQKFCSEFCYKQIEKGRKR